MHASVLSFGNTSSEDAGNDTHSIFQCNITITKNNFKLEILAYISLYITTPLYFLLNDLNLSPHLLFSCYRTTWLLQN